MSITPEFNPVPAYEMLYSLHRPELAKQLYEEMTLEEKTTIRYIMNICETRKKAIECSSNDIVNQVLSRSLVMENIIITPKISNCLKYLGYNSQCIMGIPSGECVPVGIIDW